MADHFKHLMVMCDHVDYPSGGSKSNRSSTKQQANRRDMYAVDIIILSWKNAACSCLVGEKNHWLIGIPKWVVINLSYIIRQ